MIATLASLSGVAFLTYAGVVSVFFVGTVAVRVASNVSSRIAQGKTPGREDARPIDPTNSSDPSDPSDAKGYDGITVYVETWRQADASVGERI